MLQMPSKSVTRFFIPLIDVLTLLFAVFLIMPVTHTSGEQPPELVNKTPEEQVEYLRRRTALARSRPGCVRSPARKKVPAQASHFGDRSRTGDLYDSDAAHTQIRTAEDVRRLIEHDLRKYGKSGWKLSYTILYPRNRAATNRCRNSGRGTRSGSGTRTWPSISTSPAGRASEG